MSIASEITRINTNISNAYTACNNKGATMPATQNSANLATCIDSISGGVSSLNDFYKYNYVINKGKFELMSKNGSLELDLTAESITTTSGYSNAYKNNTDITSAILGSVTTITGIYCLSSAFSGSSIRYLDMGNLTSITGLGCLQSICSSCSLLENFNLSSLKNADAYMCLSSIMSGNTIITSFSFNSLESISASKVLQSAFAHCVMQNVYFPSLKSTAFGSSTDQFNSMLYGTTGCTVHFPSNLQSVIGSWSSVTSGFSGTNTTVLFDLPATT